MTDITDINLTEYTNRLGHIIGMSIATCKMSLDCLSKIPQNMRTQLKMNLMVDSLVLTLTAYNTFAEEYGLITTDQLTQ